LALLILFFISFTGVFMGGWRIVFLELVLIFSGVLVFRSLWTLMDDIPVLNETGVHIILLVLGVILSVFAFRGISGGKQLP
jgi:hypothetical protein